ncbi:MAG: 3-methyl-2-oxobutanoate hydroxymethyltransferase, partial [Gammaproteobacteria bacterium]|nr:3-methyl-2-oxobutanoate hydroxymethyltransferase [Gammaproteobacteria bacterium]
MSKITLKTLQDKKQAGEKIAVLTAYDASFAVAADG